MLSWCLIVVGLYMFIVGVLCVVNCVYYGSVVHMLQMVCMTYVFCCICVSVIHMLFCNNRFTMFIIYV